MSEVPLLPSGYNSWENDGDEVDGAGVNYPPVSPSWFTTFTAIEVVIITEDMLLIFEEGCPDFVAQGGPNTVVFDRGVRTLQMGKAA